MDTPTRRYINPPELAQPRGYTHVVETTCRRTAYISGQVALDRQGELVGAGDMGAQAEQVFRNLQAALAAVGMGFEQMVKLTYFLADAGQIQAVRDVRDRYFDPEKLPASTAVEVRRLVREEFLLEIEAIAVLD